jgi:hypothetical protein
MTILVNDSDDDDDCKRGGIIISESLGKVEDRGKRNYCGRKLGIGRGRGEWRHRAATAYDYYLYQLYSTQRCKTVHQSRARHGKGYC